MKKKLFQLFLLSLLAFSCNNNRADQMEQYPVYTGDDLGMSYSPESTTFKVWAPTAESVRLRLYDTGEGGNPNEVVNLRADQDGTWKADISGDQKNKYYTVQARIGGRWQEEVTDPYAKAVGVNGQRGMIVDFEALNPSGWDNDQRPELKDYSEIVIYELHIRDLSMHPESGIKNKGKFLGLAELGTQNSDGFKTGLAHIKSLGVTHIHLLPSFDFRSIDETSLEDNDFNWGYDPQNYNALEGSYSTDPYDGRVRIREFKEMVKTLHENGLRVIMDVVYNHTGYTEESNFNQLVPEYYYRLDSLDNFSDGSACGNEIASEKPMVRKFIKESVLHWINEYHIDGFRFDLMGLHDITTMNEISAAARAIDPSIFLYGEGWTAGSTPLNQDEAALKANASQLDSVSVFSDDIRDGIKGHVFTPEAGGFIQGADSLKESIKFGIVAATRHPQLNYPKVNYSNAPWADSPLKTITYASCHDNHTLWDKINITNPDATEEVKKRMHLMGLTLVLTSQGVPFLHAGSEILRSKNGVENSYESPDAINQIDWGKLTEHLDVVNYTTKLIKLRKAHPAFRLTSDQMVRNHLEFMEIDNENLVAYQLKDYANRDSWKNILVAFNSNDSEYSLELPDGEWRVILKQMNIYEYEQASSIEGEVSIQPFSSIILAQKD